MPDPPGPTAGGRGRRRAAIATLVGASLVGAWHAWLVFAPCDDAYIYFVYVRNLLEGHGLGFNGERVQGFTSALWPWLVAAPAAAGLPIPTAGILASLASGVLAIGAVLRIGLVARVPLALSAAAALTLAGLGDFAFYAGNGLETPLFAALVALSVSLLFEPTGSRALLESWRTPGLLALCVLCRPEGVLVAGAVLAVLAADARQVRGAARGAARLGLLLAPPAMALRLYYGEWLPNTYHAKMGPGLENLDRGLVYLGGFARVHPVLAPAFLAGALMGAAGGRGSGRRRGCAGSLLLVFAWVVYVAVEGGDNLVGFRMLLPVLPLAVAATAVGFAERPRLGLALAALALASSAGLYHADERITRYRSNWRLQSTQREAAGRFLRQRLPPGSLVAVNAAGIIPFVTGLPTLDMLGLNDRHIARSGRRDPRLPHGHQRGDGAYVLSRRPAAILLGAAGSLGPQPFVSDREIWVSPEFRALYSPAPMPGGGWVYLRRSGAKSS